jgi:hypothetical protein
MIKRGGGSEMGIGKGYPFPLLAHCKFPRSIPQLLESVVVMLYGERLDPPRILAPQIPRTRPLDLDRF